MSKGNDFNCVKVTPFINFLTRAWKRIVVLSMKRVTFTEIDGDKPTGKGDYLRT